MMIDNFLDSPPKSQHPESVNKENEEREKRIFDFLDRMNVVQTNPKDRV